MDGEAVNLFGFTIWLSPLPPSVPNDPGALLITHLWKGHYCKVRVLPQALSTRPWAVSAAAFRKGAAHRASDIWPFLQLTAVSN